MEMKYETKKKAVPWHQITFILSAHILDVNCVYFSRIETVRQIVIFCDDRNIQ